MYIKAKVLDALNQTSQNTTQQPKATESQATSKTILQQKDPIQTINP